MQYTRLWVGLAAVLVFSFAVLGYFGYEIYMKAPPLPSAVATTSGAMVFTGADILDGQNVWQSTGGQEVGSVWGHGAYVAPDWSADFLHREAIFLLDKWAGGEGKFATLPPEQKAALTARLKTELRTNTYDPITKKIVVSEDRAAAITLVSQHYDKLFGNDPAYTELRDAYAMKATLKYFWVAGALFVAQVGFGAITAHYGVEGSAFYGFPLADWVPYSLTRTWHTQLGIFWIATTWLATGLFIAPAVSGYEPKFQRAGVNFLFVCLLIIVVGSMAGQYMAIHQQLGHEVNFWFGHQGYEYVDLGRFWQAFLLVGLFLWLGLMGRAIWPAFKNPAENRHLLALFFIASTAIALFYAAGLFWGQHTNLAIAEYWRWWVVHLWVEGFFEVFATVVIAFLFTRMGLLHQATATTSVLFSTSVFLFGGIIGTMHHLYFSGTPLAVIALGATFSALEVVPLVLIGFEAYENLTLARAKPWVQAYKWPIYFFIAVAFWNFVGAGLFGFFINAPIALYYMQGLNTTPVHGHTALFGVYGMLGIGLMLFCLKGLATQNQWKTKLLSFSFWAINIGLATMVLISVLPVGLMQTFASVEHGLWWARSAEFLQTGVMNVLRWLRVPGDTIFAIGVFTLGWFVLGLRTGWSVTPHKEDLGNPSSRLASSSKS
jgi:nitric oxide reductase subunit B